MITRRAILALPLCFVSTAWASSTEEAKKRDKPKPPPPPPPPPLKGPGKPKKGDGIAPLSPGDDNVNGQGHIRFPKVQ